MLTTFSANDKLAVIRSAPIFHFDRNRVNSVNIQPVKQNKKVHVVVVAAAVRVNMIP